MPEPLFMQFAAAKAGANARPRIAERAAAARAFQASRPGRGGHGSDLRNVSPARRRESDRRRLGSRPLNCARRDTARGKRTHPPALIAGWRCLTSPGGIGASGRARRPPKETDATSVCDIVPKTDSRARVNFTA
jgi:hypothetical protein